MAKTKAEKEAERRAALTQEERDAEDKALAEAAAEKNTGETKGSGKFKLAVDGQATVTWRGQSRVYSEEVHGASFLELAQEFAQKKGGTVA